MQRLTGIALAAMTCLSCYLDPFPIERGSILFPIKYRDLVCGTVSETTPVAPASHSRVLIHVPTVPLLMQFPDDMPETAVGDCPCVCAP